jgi:hypothetical protein
VSVRCAILFAGALLVATAARGQFFSPGALSKGHASLDGVRSCTQCHVEGNQHSNVTCLACHKEIGRRLDAGLGYHSSVKAQKCAECHREHRGVGAKLVEWAPSKEAFNHKATGWPLEGAHKKPKCNTCHEPRRMADDAVEALVEKTGRESYLGLSSKCVRCHFDEHRGQEGAECTRCHNQDGFKRAPKFSHDNAKFKLVGKHKSAQCKSCHEPLVDSKTPKGVWPAPVDVIYMQLKGIPHASCVDCHDDAHDGKFGLDCMRCHTPEAWRSIRDDVKDTTGFHDKHAFQLRGRHQAVGCRSCHGPFPGQPVKFKGTKFARCADCHIDAHVGQLKPEYSVKCEKCHDVNGFIPVLFDVKMHETARFPLEGSHRAVACNLCHKADAKVRERVPAAVKRDLLRKSRPLLVSAARLALPDVLADALDESPPAGGAPAPASPAASADCIGCHADVHGGQFRRAVGESPKPRVPAKACAECHDMSSFAEHKFKHEDSRFPLTGKHKDIACSDCHVKAKAAGGEEVVAYRPMSLGCGSCHADVHVGQLVPGLASAARADNGGPDDGEGGERPRTVPSACCAQPLRAGGMANAGTDCAACHGTTSFKPASFDHDKQGAFPLDGKHEQVQCVACHQVVEAGGKKIAQYKPVPTECGACHEDEHKQTFDDFTPPTAVPQATASPATQTRCDSCHAAVGWLPAKFAHERTGFPLEGKHTVTRCNACHGSDTNRAVPATCAGCHQDPHAQEFGLMCSACHTTELFSGPAFPVDAHRRTSFPLTGRHAALPCDECHVEKRERTFTRAALDCAACHQNDARAASLVTVDHARAPFAGVSCAACHLPARFAPARFPQHEICFPLARGVHAPVRCNACHANLPGARFTGTCTGVPLICTTCHEHAQQLEDPRHVAVPGYEFKNDKCYACHRVAG